MNTRKNLWLLWYKLMHVIQRYDKHLKYLEQDVPISEEMLVHDRQKWEAASNELWDALFDAEWELWGEKEMREQQDAYAEEQQEQIDITTMDDIDAGKGRQYAEAQQESE